MKPIITMTVGLTVGLTAGLTAGYFFGKQSSDYTKLKNIQIPPQRTLKYLLIGTTGVGKTTIFKKFHNSIKDSKQEDQVIKGFSECQLKHNIDLVDTPSIDFESSIDLRERTIQQFIQYMLPNYINHFFLVVNYERTDLMKKKILDVLKYFKKFKEMITIIVFNFQLSENQENDKIHLKQSLKYLLNSQESIIFVENNFDVEVLKKQMLTEANEFSLDDTIFEPLNEAESQQIYNELNKMFNNPYQYNESKKQTQNDDLNNINLLQEEKYEYPNQLQSDYQQQEQQAQHQKQQNNEEENNLSNKIIEMDQDQFQNNHSTSSEV